MSGQNYCLYVRGDENNNPACLAWFNGGNSFGIGKVVDHRYADLATHRAGQSYKDFFEMDFRAEEEKLTLYAEGNKICDARDNSVSAGAMTVMALKGITLFQSIEARILDGH